MAILVLRWDTGYYILKFFGDEITKFFNYAYEGAAVVYGDPWMVFHPFAMMVCFFNDHSFIVKSKKY